MKSISVLSIALLLNNESASGYHLRYVPSQGVALVQLDAGERDPADIGPLYGIAGRQNNMWAYGEQEKENYEHPAIEEEKKKKAEEAQAAMPMNEPAAFI